MASEGAGQGRPLLKRPQDVGIRNRERIFHGRDLASPLPSQSHWFEESSHGDGPEGEMVKPQAPESQPRV